jgi:hypothetical protein
MVDSRRLSCCSEASIPCYSFSPSNTAAEPGMLAPAKTAAVSQQDDHPHCSDSPHCLQRRWASLCYLVSNASGGSILTYHCSICPVSAAQPVPARAGRSGSLRVRSVRTAGHPVCSKATWGLDITGRSLGDESTILVVSGVGEGPDTKSRLSHT